MLRSLLAALLLTLAAPAIAVESGQSAPSINATDALTGAPFTLAAQKGKIVVLEWTNPDCPFTHKFYDQGHMQSYQERAAKEGIVWVSVNSSAEGKEGHMEDDAAARASVAEHHAHPTYYLRDSNGAIGHAYGATSTPHLFVIDAQGRLAYQGAVDDMPTADPADIASAHNYLWEAVEAIKAGRPVPTPRTTAYGCFVKYAG